MKNSRLANLLRDHPVVITGMGCCSTAGHSVDALWAAVVRGAGTARWEEVSQAGQPVQYGVCRVPPLTESSVSLAPVRRRDHSVRLAWVAAVQALQMAGFDPSECPSTFGLVGGSSRGPLGKIEEAVRRVEAAKYPPSLSADATLAVISGALTQALKIRGPSSTVSATCASAGFAIAQAAEQILLGKTDLMLAGGAEASLHPAVITQLAAAGVLGTHESAADLCRPFDRSRDGLVLGEGSAFLVLESLEHAQRRGAIPLARLEGWGICVDESGRAGVNESGAGLVDAMRLALDAGSLTPGQIDYLNVHGTGTRLNDPAEARAIQAIFGACASSLPCSSTKPVTGHCLGATPALEAVICVEALRHQLVPPTAACRDVDPACAINVVTSKAQPARLQRVMSNSLGFWGCHASLIFGKM